MGNTQPSGIGNSLLGGPAGLVLLVAMAEMVKTEVAEPDPGVTAAGEKEQLSTLAIPGQDSVIGVSKDPDCVCAVTVKVPDWPATIDNVVGEALRLTVGGGMFKLQDGV